MQNSLWFMHFFLEKECKCLLINYIITERTAPFKKNSHSTLGFFFKDAFYIHIKRTENLENCLNHTSLEH